MSKDQLGDRRKAVEESFFARQNEALRQPLRESEETKRKKQALSAASGVTDDGLLLPPNLPCRKIADRSSHLQGQWQRTLATNSFSTR
jgi:hypothetical protein